MESNNAISLKGEEYKAIREMLNDIFYNKTTISKQDVVKQVDWFLDLLEERGENDAYQYNFAYMMKSKCYCNLNQLQLALKYNKIALDYIKKANINYNKKIENLLISWWGLGKIYGELKDSKSSMYYYNKCEKQYRKDNNLHYLAKILNAKAYYLQEESLVLRAIELENSLNINILNKNLDLTDMYDTKFNIYINKFKFEKAWSTILEINFNNVLKNKMIKTYEEIVNINNCNQLAL